MRMAVTACNLRLGRPPQRVETLAQTPRPLAPPGLTVGCLFARGYARSIVSALRSVGGCVLPCASGTVHRPETRLDSALQPSPLSCRCFPQGVGQGDGSVVGP
jgi:hypothetical protein